MRRAHQGAGGPWIGMIVLTAGMIVAAVVRGTEAGETPESPKAAPRKGIDVLRAEPKPEFAAGHTLPPLSRWGWTLPLEMKLELAERWGYALEMVRPVTHALVDEIEQRPESEAAHLVRLAREQPQKYKLAVLTDRPFSRLLKDPQFAGTPFCLVDADGKPMAGPAWKLYNPELGTPFFDAVAKETAEPLSRLRKLAPVAVVLNGGEYGLTVFGHNGPFLERSPAVVKAKGERSWFDYLSARKLAQEMPVTEACRAAVPDRAVYLWYHFAGIPTWSDWPWSLGTNLLAASDMPDQSLYYMQFNSGWTGSNDLLSLFLEATAGAIAVGQPLSYNWVCAGWDAHKHFSSAEAYMGFLKSLYTAGMIGGVAGYFSYPPKGFGAAWEGPTPSWLWQMTILGHVHALFSHLEPIVRGGELVAGEGTHRRRRDLPAYEMSTGNPDVRVLARRLKGANLWLISAWAANEAAAEARVVVPFLGEVVLQARPEGSVYLVFGEEATPYEPPIPRVMRVDETGMQPSEGAAARVQAFAERHKITTLLRKAPP